MMLVWRLSCFAVAIVLCAHAPADTCFAQPPRQQLKYEDKLPSGAIARLGTLRFRCRDNINCVAFSLDGKYVAAGGGSAFYYDDNAVNLWNCATGELIRRFEGHRDRYWALAFTPDGKTLISGGADGVFFWKVSDGTLIRQIETNSIVSALAVSADGKRCAAGTMSGDIFLWSENGQKLIHSIKVPTHVECLKFSPDDQMLVSTGWDMNTKQNVRLWDVATGKQTWQLPGQSLEISWKNTVDFSPDGMQLAMGTNQGQIQIWNIPKRKKVRVLAGHEQGKRARVLGFANKGSLLVSQGRNGKVRVWNMKTGKLKETLPVKFSWQLGMSPDGDSIAYGDHRTVRLWDIKAQKHRHNLPGHQQPINFVAFSPDGKVLASCADDHTIRLWNLQTNKEIRKWKSGSKNDAWHLSYSADGKTLLSANWQDARLWDTSTGGLKLALGDKKSWALTQARLLPDQKLLVTVAHKHAKVWRINPRHVVKAFPVPAKGIVRAAISPDGRHLALFGSEKVQGNRIAIWDIATGKRKGELDPKATDMETMAFSADGNYLASAGTYNSQIRVWDIGRMKLRHRLRTRDSVRALAFSRTGRYLASAGEGTAIRIWDMKTGKAVGHFTSPRGRIVCLAFAPNADILASGANDCNILLWDLHKKIVTPLLSTVKLLKRLATAYKSYGLPLPPADAKPVLFQVNGENCLGFLIKPAQGKKEPRLLIGSEHWPDISTKIIEATPRNLQKASSSFDDLIFAIQCQVRGLNPMAQELFKISDQIVPKTAEAELAMTAWNYWELKLGEPDENRVQIAQRLRIILNAKPKLFGPNEKGLLKSLELALAPSKAKPGSIEALIDDLIEIRSVHSYGNWKHDPRYLKLARRGFEAVPTLIKHLDDHRLTKTYRSGFNNFSGYHYRIRDFMTDLLQELAGKDLGAWRLRGDTLTKTTATVWWKQASKVGEEAYMLRHVLGGKDAKWSNDLMLEVIVTKYPKHLPKIYRQMVDHRPKMISWPVAETIANSSLSRARKRELFVYGAKSKNLDHRRSALRHLRKLDAKQFDILLVKTLEGLPNVPSQPCWHCEEAALAVLVGQTANPQVWAALEKYAKRCDVGVRLEILNNRSIHHKSSPTKQNLRFLARFLKDATVRDISTNRESYGGPAAGAKYSRLEVRNFAAICLANIFGLKTAPKKDWSPADWAKLRREVQQRLDRAGNP